MYKTHDDWTRREQLQATVKNDEGYDGEARRDGGVLNVGEHA